MKGVSLLKESRGGRDVVGAVILATLGQNGPMSRAGIARALDMHPTTVGQLSRRLIHAGLVETLQNGPSNGGRSGQLLNLVATAGRAVGVKLALHHVSTVDMRIDGEVLKAETHPFDPRAPDALAQLGLLLQHFVYEDEIPLLGVGLGLPGVVSAPDIGTADVDLFGWSHVPLGRHLRGVLGVPVMVENNVNALAIGESVYGLGRAHRTFTVITIGRGVGFAAVLNGVLHRGSHGQAGEIGHLSFDRKGPLCSTCGQPGCLEVFAGEAGLLMSARSEQLALGGGGLERLRQLADGGNTTALLVYQRAATQLGRFVASTVTTLDPDVVLIAGEGTVAWTHWEKPFTAALRQHLPLGWGDVRVQADSWDDTTWAKGAAAMLLGTAFDRVQAAPEVRTQVLARLHRQPDFTDREVILAASQLPR